MTGHVQNVICCFKTACLSLTKEKKKKIQPFQSLSLQESLQVECCNVNEMKTIVPGCNPVPLSVEIYF